jgi:hypothetical protein
VADGSRVTSSNAEPGAAAFFSVKMVLFPGAPLAVVAMAVAIEAAKLVIAGWLAGRWRATACVWRLTLVALDTGRGDGAGCKSPFSAASAAKDS